MELTANVLKMLRRDSRLRKGDDMARVEAKEKDH